MSLDSEASSIAFNCPAGLAIDGVFRGDGILHITPERLIWSSGSDRAEFDFTQMALHAYSLGNETDTRPHLLIQLLSTEGEDESGPEVLLVLSNQLQVEVAFKTMNEFASAISDTAVEGVGPWITADDLVKA